MSSRTSRGFALSPTIKGWIVNIPYLSGRVVGSYPVRVFDSGQRGWCYRLQGDPLGCGQVDGFRTLDSAVLDAFLRIATWAQASEVQPKKPQ